MRKHSDQKQKEPAKPDGAFESHKYFTKRPKESASTEPASHAARSQPKGPSVMITPATPQPRYTTQGLPSTSDFEHSLNTNSPVVMASPYRGNGEDPFPPVLFSKDLLIRMDHKKQNLEIDLFRPDSKRNVFPPQDLSPLCLYRELRTLKITGMMQSYQSYIWLVVWLNPQLTDLTLEMAGNPEPLDMNAIAEAQKYAMCKPTMREVAQGKTSTEVPRKFQIVRLRLVNFVVQEAPFQWFSDTNLQKVELHRCEDAGFQLPIIKMRGYNISVTV